MNSHSVVHNFSNIRRNTPNFALISQVADYKQNKLDTNRAKLQNLYDKYSMLQVHNDVDQDYIEGRLETVRDITNKYANMDLSDDNFAASLMGNVSQVLDDKVKNAVLSTKLIQSEDAQWAKMKEKDLGKYNDKNRQFALAHSDRRNYEKSQEVGTIYKGGAGFIEYRDNSKKVMDNLPKLRETFKMEFYETGPLEGHFRNIITSEAVDKNVLEGAVNLLFDDKDRMQMNIDAWATYDGVSDDVIKEDWDKFNEPEKAQVRSAIDAYEDAINDPTQADKKEEYKQKLELYKKKEADLNSNTYEKATAAYGREGAYNSLYSNKYIGQIVDTYSAPTVTDRKIDETHKANIEFNHKLEEAQKSEKRWDMDYVLKVRALELKGGGKGGNGGNGGNTSDPNDVNKDFTKTDIKVAGTKKEDESYVDQFQKTESESINKAKGVLKNEIGFNLTNKEFQEVSKQLRPGNMSSNEKVTVTVRGEKHVIDMNKHYDTFLNLYNNAQNNSPEKEAYYKNVKDGVWKTISEISTMAASGNGNIVRHLPNFSFKVIENKKGEFEMVKTENKNANYYNYLAKKQGLHARNPDKYGALSKAEQKTLEVYTASTLVMDDELSSGNKQAVYRFAADKALLGVKTNGLLPTMGALSNVFGGMTQAVDKYAKYTELQKHRKLTPEELKYLDIGKVFTDSKSFLNNGLGGIGDSLTDIGAYDSNYTNKMGNQMDFGDYEERLENRFTNISKQFEEDLIVINNMRSTYKMTTEPGTYSHTELTKFLGAEKGLKADNKSMITIEREDADDGVGFKDEDGDVIVSFVAKAGEEPTKIPVAASLLKARGISFESAEMTPYRAKLGNLAAKVPLGNNAISNEKRVLERSRNGDKLPVELHLTKEFYKSLEADQDLHQSIKEKHNLYNSGKYIFNIEPYDGTYRRTISLRNSEGRLEVVHVGEEDFGDKMLTGEIKEYTKNSYVVNENLFLEYIKKSF